MHGSLIYYSLFTLHVGMWYLGARTAQTLEILEKYSGILLCACCLAGSWSSSALSKASGRQEKLVIVQT